MLRRRDCSVYLLCRSFTVGCRCPAYATTAFSPLDTFMYPMTNLEMFFPMKFFLLICAHMASTSKFSLVARLATLGNSGNLHKSKNISSFGKFPIDYL